MHRIGFHFPTEVVSQVCALYGIRLTRGGKVIDESKDSNQLFMRLYQKGELALDKEVKDQVTINTEAKQTIKDLFPNIPDKDLFQIIKTAFQLGDGKVGTADEIPLVRRAQLSVVAHIRHIYTQYDRLLRRVDYKEARLRVEKDTLKKLVEWRGDDDQHDEAGKRAVEEVFREVIVISDEEDSSDDGDDGDDDDHEADETERIGDDNVRVEELPVNAYGSVQDQPLSSSHDLDRDAAPAGYRFVPRVASRHRLTDDRIAQRDRNRYAIWDQARRDYRSAISSKLAQDYEPRMEAENARRDLVPLNGPAHFPRQAVTTQAMPVSQWETDYEVRPVPSSSLTIDLPFARWSGLSVGANCDQARSSLRQPSRPDFIRRSDGVVYERVVSRPPMAPESHWPPYRRSPPLARVNGTTFGHSQPASPRPFSHRDPHRPVNFEGGDGSIIPSIEGPDPSYPSPLSRRNPFDQTRPHQTFAPEPRWDEDRPLPEPAPAAHDYLTNDTEVQTFKRRRVEEARRSPDRFYDHSFLREFRSGDAERSAERSYLPPPHPGPIYAQKRTVDLSEHHSSTSGRYLVPESDFSRFPEPGATGLGIREPPSPHPYVRRPVSDAYDVRDSAAVQPRYISAAHVDAQRHGEYERPATRPALMADERYEPQPPAADRGPRYHTRGEYVTYDDHRPLEYVSVRRDEYAPPSSRDVRDQQQSLLHDTPSRRPMDATPAHLQPVHEHLQARREYNALYQADRDVSSAYRGWARSSQTYLHEAQSTFIEKLPSEYRPAERR